jgi:hypothetical protein
MPPKIVTHPGYYLVPGYYSRLPLFRSMDKMYNPKMAMCSIFSGLAEFRNTHMAHATVVFGKLHGSFKPDLAFKLV